MPGITRRELLAASGLLVGLMATGAAGNALADDRVFLRPPGALAEPDFSARCIRCQACLTACPTRIIQPISIADSLPHVSTPTLVFSRAYCTFCESEQGRRPRCAAACPTGALASPTDQPRIDGVAEVSKTACVAWDWKGCTVCVDECPRDAISLDEKRRPIVDGSICDGCGLCELVCPSASLRSYSDHSESKGVVVVPRERGAL